MVNFWAPDIGWLRPDVTATGAVWDKREVTRACVELVSEAMCARTRGGVGESRQGSKINPLYYKAEKVFMPYLFSIVYFRFPARHLWRLLSLPLKRCWPSPSLFPQFQNDRGKELGMVTRPRMGAAVSRHQQVGPEIHGDRRQWQLLSHAQDFKWLVFLGQYSFLFWWLVSPGNKHSLYYR